MGAGFIICTLGARALAGAGREGAAAAVIAITAKSAAIVPYRAIVSSTASYSGGLAPATAARTHWPLGRSDLGGMPRQFFCGDLSMSLRLSSPARLRAALAALFCLILVSGFAGTWAAEPGAAPALSTAAHHVGAPAGNGASGSGRSEAILVADVVLLMVVGRLLGEGMQRLGQPALMGQLLAGIMLGPSLLGWVWPQAHALLFPADPAQKGMIDGVSQIGILMLLLLTGMETDLKLVRKSGFAAVAISLSGIALPFACGFTLGQFLPSALLPGDGSRLVVDVAHQW